MSTVTGLGEAQRIERDRSVKFRYKIKDTDFGELFAELTVRHQKAGINYFTYERTTEDFFAVGLSNIEVGRYDGSAFAVERFTAFQGIGLFRYEAGKRFSRKKLLEAAERGLAEFTELYESGDERVLAYFDADAEALTQR